MSIWLRKRLLLWGSASMLVAVLWSNGNVLYAQNDDDEAEQEQQFGRRTKLSRDDAAKWFVRFLEAINSEKRGYLSHATDDSPMFSSISLKSHKQFNQSEKFEVLITEMASDWAGPRKKIRLESEGDKTATVVVEEDKTPNSRPLVLIEEDGAWGVDLLETYAKWNNLEGAAKAQAIFNLTGIELPELPVTPEFLRAKENARRASCQSRLKQIMLGIKMYVQDYDELLPLSKPWSDSLQPYLKSEQIFNCPSLKQGQRYGYAYNGKLAQKNETIFNDTSKVVAVYETSVLKRNTYGIGENLAFRHLDGANFGYLGGHVKWHPKDKVPSFNLGPVANYSSGGAPPPY